MKPTVVAFHGGSPFFNSIGVGLGPEDLRRDMNDPEWVDIYAEGFDVEEHYKDLKAIESPLILAAYSMGGSVVGHLSNTDLPIIGAVLYEAPLFGTDVVGGDFPVLWIRNEFQSTKRREAEFMDTYCVWAKDHDIKVLCGAGGHSGFRFGWPPITHNWDTTLNPYIANWIETIQ